MIFSDKTVADLEVKVLSGPSNTVNNPWYEHNIHLLENGNTAKTISPLSWAKRDKEEIAQEADAKIEAIRNGYVIQEELYDKGISVPKPLGMFSIRWDDMFKDWVKNYERYQCTTDQLVDLPRYIMKTIQGICGATNDKRDKTSERSLRNEEIQRAKDLGYAPGDDFRHNYMYLPEEEKVVLIDFDLWQKPKKPFARVDQ